MIVEKMLELLVWKCINIQGTDINKVNKRIRELEDEFLEDYVINKT